MFFIKFLPLYFNNNFRELFDKSLTRKAITNKPTVVKRCVSSNVKKFIFYLWSVFLAKKSPILWITWTITTKITTQANITSGL